MEYSVISIKNKAKQNQNFIYPVCSFLLLKCNYMFLPYTR